MLKGLFFGIASTSACNSIYPLLNELASEYELIMYNSAEFAPSKNHRYGFKSYPSYKNGYHPACMNERTSYLEFGEILIDTTNSLSRFLINEIENEKPDFILHSHLAIWGRLIAARFNIPVITIHTTFFMDKRIMLSYFKKNLKNGEAIEHLKNTVRVSRKLSRIHEQFHLSPEPDIWDIYVNKEGLNLSLILESFQPGRHLLESTCRCIGYHNSHENTGTTRDIVYIAMGTILNRNEDFYRICLRALQNLPHHCVLVVGKLVDIDSLGEIPNNVEVVPFADQIKMLNRAIVFISRGGMTSVQESIYAQTPLIVIPEMAEQQINAKTIEALGAGLHLPVSEVTEESFLTSINQIIRNHSSYIKNIQAILTSAADETPVETAKQLITSFLRK